MARIWPNGEFSLGYGIEGEEGTRSEEWSWTGGSRGLTEEELDVRLAYLDGWLDVVAAVCSVSAHLAGVYLTLSDILNSHKSTPRPKYGLKGLTGKGRKMIRSGAYLLEQKFGRDDVVMITLTVPTLRRPERIAVAKQWGALTNRLVQYLTRALLKAGRPPAIVGCVEVQTGRLQKYSEGYLHLHLVAPAHSNTGGVWAIDAKALRAWWKAAIERVTKTTLTHLPRVETAIVEKSVEAYLAKYLSKGSDEGMAEFVDDLGEECVPGQWWFCSAPMRDAIRKNTLSGDNCGALLESLIEHLLEVGSGEGFEYVRHVDRLVDGKLKTCGWVGRLTPEMRAEIELMLRSS